MIKVYASLQGRTTAEIYKFYRQALDTIDDMKYQQNIIMNMLELI